MTAYLTIFRIFPTAFQIFPKPGFSKTCSKVTRTLPKTFEENLKMFRSYTNEVKYKLTDKFDVSEIIDIFTSKDIENMPPESRMWFRMNLRVRSFQYSKTLVCI